MGDSRIGREYGPITFAETHLARLDRRAAGFSVCDF
jgi:hypothetical protein